MGQSNQIFKFKQFAGEADWSDETFRRRQVESPFPNRLKRHSGFVGERSGAAAKQLGIDTVGGLLLHLPVDASAFLTISRIEKNQKCTIMGKVVQVQSRPVRRRGMKPLVEVLVEDGSGSIRAAFFNQPWLVDRLTPGDQLFITGVSKRPGRFSVTAHAHASSSGQLSNPDQSGQEPDSAQVAEGRYPVSDGISSLEVATRAAALLENTKHLLEPLSAIDRRDQRLPAMPAAISEGHRGGYEQARARLAFDELLFNQIEYLRRRRLRESSENAQQLDQQPILTSRWLQHDLPFELTLDQQNAVAVIEKGLASAVPMQRLLMGDVGSGKTVVALHAMLRAVECGHQAALMAPTETLARQHAQTIQLLLNNPMLPVELLTGSTKLAARQRILSKLASGETGIVVGTHALLEDPVEFRSLAVAVIDEQHRFGVKQRQRLLNKAPDGFAPHALHMTATPIPRTLALLQYGDLDVIEIRQLPKGRKPIQTFVCASDAERVRAYQRIREEVSEGRKAYVICPLVEDSDEIEAKSATAEYEMLKTGQLTGLNIVLLHGQQSAADKTAAMESFAKGDGQVLVSTTVVEVGVDVPQATVMLIENAERFGISQLHQLRGRVGRGEQQSICLLFGEKRSKRLQALEKHRDGFKLAEIDLELRGEGELVGLRQSGVAKFRYARMPDDRELLLRSRELAIRLEKSDPHLISDRNSLLGICHGEWRRQLQIDGEGLSGLGAGNWWST